MTMRSLLLSTAAGLLLGAALPSGLVQAQDWQVKDPNKEVLCPHPGSFSVHATSAPSVVAADFPPPAAGQQFKQIGDPAINKAVRYTFKLAEAKEMCCEVTNAVVSVNLQKTGQDVPQNDGIALMHNGAAIPGFNQSIGWAPGSTGPMTKSITWTLDATALGHLNSDHRISLYVQDDTTVTAAKLQGDGCCVKHHP